MYKYKTIQGGDSYEEGPFEMEMGWQHSENDKRVGLCGYAKLMLKEKRGVRFVMQ